MALIAFLRGVNVGGYRTFRPSVLAFQLKEYGAVNIGAAGTFVVRKNVSKSKLRFELLRHLPFEPEIMMCTADELIAVSASHPFKREPERPDIVRFVSVLARVPKLSPPIPVSIPDHGRWLLRILSRHDRFLFGLYRREMKAITCLGNLDKLFGVPATTRNWNTIGSILKLLDKD